MIRQHTKKMIAEVKPEITTMTCMNNTPFIPYI
jgi:hypothetical protein